MPDPEEMRLRELWYETRDTDPQKHARVHQQLSDYLWDRANRIVAEDRAKHPKAKRNQPKNSELSAPTRALP